MDFVANFIRFPSMQKCENRLIFDEVTESIKVGTFLRHSVDYYRPICLLSIFNKLLEKLMYRRLYNLLTENNILYEYQFGFRKNHSTKLALIDVIDDIYSSLDNSETAVVGIYLDLHLIV